jgi:Arc/MetJ-type ribon-helix-helix transcriptional regulator
MQDEKKNVTLSIESDLLDWVDDNIKAMRFASKSQAVNYALHTLKDQSQGISPDNPKRFWKKNEQDQDTFPEIISSDDLSTSMYPDYPIVPMKGLNGWSSDMVPSEYWCYNYKKEIGKASLSIQTEKGQRKFKGKIDGDYTLLVFRNPYEYKWTLQHNGGKDSLFDEIEIRRPIKTIEDLAGYLEDLTERLQILGSLHT